MAQNGQIKIIVQNANPASVVVLTIHYTPMDSLVLHLVMQEKHVHYYM